MLEFLHNALHPFDLDGLVLLGLSAYAILHDRFVHHKEDNDD